MTKHMEIANVHSPMTVGQAKNIYRMYGDDLEGFYQTIYRELIGSRPLVELSNSNYLHALQLTSLILRNTHHRFCMLSGGAGDFLQLLGTEFRGMLARLAAVNGKAELIILNAAPSPVIADLQRAFSGTLEVCRGETDNPEKISHFIVADDMVRIEKPHEPLTDATDANTIEARVLFNNPVEAAQHRHRFSTFLNLVNPQT